MTRHTLVHFVLFCGAMSCLLGCGTKEIDPSQLEERCSDGLDNNGDGKTDCEDATCKAFPTCNGEEHCYNGIDDDGDGLIDCEDDACTGSFLCLQDIEDCANGRDDDSDGRIDCDDSACQRTSVCSPGAEACTGGIDEDGDGRIDCEDDDCKSVFVCLLDVELIDNGIDDDGDGQVDCEDDDWARTGDCLAGGERCSDGLDNDGDGALDCDDPDCAFTSLCLRPVEVCNNALDDNGDGLTDCEDARCKTSAFCLVEICDDDVDNDGDGLIDCLDVSDCSPTLFVCLAEPEVCDDGMDNDRDEATDCADPDCAQDPSCIMASQEVCDDEVDNDRDGQRDCDDPDCAQDPACLVVGMERCEDEQDNDGDGLVDCEDDDCVGDASCQAPTCTARVLDLNGVSIPDCEDATCALFDQSCRTGLGMELCDGDGIDNDGDGDIDCDDADCSAASYCACPRDAATGEALDCQDPRCLDDLACVCEAAGRIDAGAFGMVPDCSVQACVDLHPGCQEGLDMEFCDGYGVDNDSSGSADCADSACAAVPECQCTNPNDPIACVNQADTCGNTAFCQCLSNYKPDGQGGMIPDCTNTACAMVDPSCQTGLGMELCNGDGIDNDGNGYTDCDDIQCDGQGLCLARTCPTVLVNGVDVPDCSDAYCQQREAACLPNVTELCYGGVDNDGDGDIDCDDADCIGDLFCPCPTDVGSGEPLCSDQLCSNEEACICQSSLITSPHGMIPDCTLQACQNTSITCDTTLPTEQCAGDGVDNDNDGYIDCDDLDCSGVGICPALVCAATVLNLDLLPVPDCTDIACAQLDPSCQPGPEVCIGNQFDNDGDNDSDCDDSDCDGTPYCACPFDAGSPRCSDDRCATTEPYCICLTNSNGLTNTIGELVPDCNESSCQALPECMTAQPQEFCNGDGVDNDDDGLIDCQDPDCHDFADLTNLCTRELCGDPATGYIAVPYGDATQLVLNTSAEVSAAFPDSDGAPTIKYGDLTILSSTIPTSRLRCVLPDTHNTPNVQNILTIDDSLITDAQGLETLQVLTGLAWMREESASGFEGLINLQHVLGRFSILEPTYTSRPSPISFVGLGSLVTVGEDFELMPQLANLDDFNIGATKISFEGLDALVQVGGNLITTYGVTFEGEDDRTLDMTQGCDASRPNNFFNPILQVRGNFARVDNMSGLGSLRRVGGDICLSPEVSGFDFTPSPRLEYVGGDLLLKSAEEFPSFTKDVSFAGLNQLERVEGSLGLSPPDSFSSGFPPYRIVNYAGLGALTFIGGSLLTSEVDGFIDFSGLNNLITIGGDLQLVGEEFTSAISVRGDAFAPLSSLTRVGGNLTLSRTHLDALTGLGGLSQLGGIILHENANALDLSVLTGITTLSSGGIYIRDSFQSPSGSLNLSGLGNISFVQGDVSVGTESYLNALSNVTHIGGTLDLSNFDTIQRISDPFPNLNFLGGLRIQNTPSFTDMTGFPPGQTTMPGDLVLAGSNMSSIAGLNVLSSIQTIGGDLELSEGHTTVSFLSGLTRVSGRLSLSSNSALSSLAPLANLTSVGGIYMYANNALLSLQGLHQITESNGPVDISNNDALTDLTLTNLTIIRGNLYLYDNDGLLNLNGFDNLTTIEEGLYVGWHRNIQNLSGLNSLTNVGKDVDLSNNTLLKSLTGLDSLAQIGGRLYISGNTQIDNISALSSLTQVQGIRIINTQLTSLNGLENIPVVLTGELQVNDHPQLTDISAISHVREVYDGLGVASNPQLVVLALDDLEIVGGFSIAINNNASLDDITALLDLTSLPDPLITLSVNNNANLCTQDAIAVRAHLASIGHTGSSFINTNKSCP